MSQPSPPSSQPAGPLRPAAPAPARTVVRFMFAAATVSAVTLIISLARVPAVKAALRKATAGLTAAAWITLAGLVAAAGGCSSAKPHAGLPPGEPPARLPPGLAIDCLVRAPRCYAPVPFRVAYGVQPLVGRGFDGRGQTVLLTEYPALQGTALTNDIRQDLARYDREFHLPAAPLQVINSLAKAALPWQAGSEEIEDVETVHAVAPGAAIKVLLLNTPASLTPGSWVSAVDAALHLALTQGSVISVSDSYGENCFTARQVTRLHAALRAAQAQHVTVIAPSGDTGAAGQPCPAFTSVPAQQVNLPAADPLVLAVGGTSLAANPHTGTYTGETAWNTRATSAHPRPLGSGGGFSHRFPRPSYQHGVPGTGPGRGVPDVAADAAPSTGLALAASDGPGRGVIAPASGTSASAPFWAGLIAIANQYAGRHLGFVNPALYQIGTSSHYHDAFHDITRGTNTITIGSSLSAAYTVPPGWSKTFTGYPAAPGWDPVTGWGTPNAQHLIPLLAQYTRNPAAPA
jgi:subtilase family serine protease